MHRCAPRVRDREGRGGGRPVALAGPTCAHQRRGASRAAAQALIGTLGGHRLGADTAHGDVWSIGGAVVLIAPCAVRAASWLRGRPRSRCLLARYPADAHPVTGPVAGVVGCTRSGWLPCVATCKRVSRRDVVGGQPARVRHGWGGHLASFRQGPGDMVGCVGGAITSSRVATRLEPFERQARCRNRAGARPTGGRTWGILIGRTTPWRRMGAASFRTGYLRAWRTTAPACRRERAVTTELMPGGGRRGRASRPVFGRALCRMARTVQGFGSRQDGRVRIAREVAVNHVER